MILIHSSNIDQPIDVPEDELTKGVYLIREKPLEIIHGAPTSNNIQKQPVQPVQNTYSPVIKNNNNKNDNVYVVRQEQENDGFSNRYRFSYELSDGQAREESSNIEVRGPEQAVNRVTGSYRYVSPDDGRTYEVKYVADENGFRAMGDHLPVSSQI